MPPVERWPLWLAIGVMVARSIVEAEFGISLFWAEVALLLLVWVFLASLYIRRRWVIRREVHFLRSLSAQKRDEIYRTLGKEELKPYFEQRLEEHGAPESAGVVERFAFSPVDRRERAWLAYIVICTAALVGFLPESVAPGSAGRLAVVALAMLLLAAGGFVWTTVPALSRTFEVSPFGLSEVRPNGVIQRLLWGSGVVLHNRPRLRRIEVRHIASDGAIKIPYQVVGFDRLLELILEHGGFKSEAG